MGLRGQRGQVIPLLAVGFAVVLVGMMALVVDVGHALRVKRQLQAAVDAAALAGAQALPDGSAAAATARAYSTAGVNATTDTRGATVSVATRCLASTPACSGPNAVVVEEHATVATKFARLFGLASFSVGARATACSPCAGRALDVVIVLDRTGSMCEDHYGRSDPACTDLANARAGIKTFLSSLDPAVDRVALAVLPPAATVAKRCSTPDSADYDTTTSAYVVVHLKGGFAKRGLPDPTSELVSTLDCVKAAGRTSYATALEQAQDELTAAGRPDADPVIVFFSDGAANTGPAYYPFWSPYRLQPCHQGVTSAAAIKARGTRVFSIGYDLDAVDGGANQCTSFVGTRETPAISAYLALQAIADDNAFYAKPTPGDLSGIFAGIARDIGRGRSRLVPDGS